MAEFASNAARELASERGIDASEISGSGSDGAITVADIRGSAPRTPDGLGDAGGELWGAILADLPEGWELDRRELAILERAARQADDVARLEAIVEREGAEAIGSTKQPVVSPYLIEARQGRTSVARLLGQIALPDEDAKPATSASQRGRHAADARWKREHAKWSSGG